MTYEEQVAAAANPKEGLLALARALDYLAAVAKTAAGPDKWGEWGTLDPDHDAQARAVHEAKVAKHPTAEQRHAGAPLEEHAWTAVETDDHMDVALDPPTEDRKEARRTFERNVLKLSEQLNDDGTDWNEVYALGGPLWLYLGNRDLVNSYPYHVKQAMIAEVELDSPQDAQEMGRDLLKAPCETGPGSTGMHMA